MSELFSQPDLRMPAGHAQARRHALIREITATGPRPARRRLTLAAVGAAAAIAVAVAVPAVEHLTAAATPVPATGSQAQLAAFTVVPGTDGTVTITPRRSQDIDPAALTTALNEAGVPALVKVGVVCEGLSTDGIWTFQVQRHPEAGTHTLVISPVAVPPGSLLVISIPQPTDGMGLRLTVSPAGTTPTCHPAGATPKPANNGR